MKVEIPEPASLSMILIWDATGRSFVIKKWMGWYDVGWRLRPDSSRMEYPGLPFTTEGWTAFR